MGVLLVLGVLSVLLVLRVLGVLLGLADMARYGWCGRRRIDVRGARHEPPRDRRKFRRRTRGRDWGVFAGQHARGADKPADTFRRKFRRGSAAWQGPTDGY